MQTEWLIVGAGFTGAVIAERIASQRNERVLVIDKRPHIGGNAYDYTDESGITVHLYGPHIFHTNSQRVWDYLSRFTSWRDYEHRVVAEIGDQLVPVPFNLESLEMCFGNEQSRRLEALLVDEFGRDTEIPILKLLERTAGELRGLAQFIYDNVFLGYTTKQWGLPPEQLDASVTARVPVRINKDNRYFRDRFQGIPAEGYTELFRRLLDHRNITVELGTDYRDVGRAESDRRIVYTGPIDEFYNYRFGELPYRSLKFELVTDDAEIVQEAGTINYPNRHRYTRTTEMKILTGQQARGSVLLYEYPTEQGDPFYPVPRLQNAALYRKYAALAYGNRRVVFAGRLADYRYYNMDQAIARGLSVFEKELNSDAQAG